MRPKKIIVIIDPHEDRQSITCYSLWVNSMKAIGAPSLSAARDIAAEIDVDLFLGYWPIDEAWFAQLGKELATQTLYMASKKGTSHCLADATLKVETASMNELLDHIKTMTARKRGPKQGAHRPVTTVHPAPAEACA